jgi:hypothetical protein
VDFDAEKIRNLQAEGERKKRALGRALRSDPTYQYVLSKYQRKIEEAAGKGDRVIGVGDRNVYVDEVLEELKEKGFEVERDANDYGLIIRW